MKRISLLFAVLFACLGIHASTINITMGSYVSGFAETNYFRIIPVGTNVLANGTVIARGLPILCYPDVNGFFATNLVIGNYQITNQFVNLLFQSFNDNNTYNLQDVLLPGFNTFAPTGVRKLTSNDGSVVFSPGNGTGVVDLSAQGSGGGPPNTFIRTLNGVGTNTALLNPTLTNAINFGTFTSAGPLNSSNNISIFNPNGNSVFQANTSGDLTVARSDGTPELNWNGTSATFFRNGNEFLASTSAETDLYDQSNRIGLSLVSQTDGSTLVKLPLNISGSFLNQLGGKSNYFSGDVFSPHFWGDGSHLTGISGGGGLPGTNTVIAYGDSNQTNATAQIGDTLYLNTNALGTVTVKDGNLSISGGVAASTMTNSGLISAHAVATDGLGKQIAAALIEGDIAGLVIDLSQRVLTNDSRNLVFSSSTNNLGTDVSSTRFWGDGSHLTGLTESQIANLPTDLSQRVLTNDSRNLVLSGSTNNLGTDVSSTRFWGDGSHLTGLTESQISGLLVDLSQRVTTNDSRNLTLSGSTNYLGTDLASSNYWGNVSHAVGFPVGGVAPSPTISITTNGNQVTPALANPLIISEMDIGDFYGTNLTIGGAYYSTNPYPIVAGTALEMDKSYQFVITNNAVNITGFTAVSNGEVSVSTIGISNSAAGSIPFTFPVCILSTGGTLSSYTIPSATVVHFTFLIWSGWTNVTIWGAGNGVSLPGTNTTIAVTDQYKTNVYNATANSHYWSNSVGFVLMSADSILASNKNGNFFYWSNGVEILNSGAAQGSVTLSDTASNAILQASNYVFWSSNYNWLNTNGLIVTTNTAKANDYTQVGAGGSNIVASGSNSAYFYVGPSQWPTNANVWQQADYNVAVNDTYILMGAAHKATMPSPTAAFIPGHIYWIQQTGAGTNAILPNGAETFNGNMGTGLTKLTNTAAGKCTQLWSNGTNWWYVQF